MTHPRNLPTQYRPRSHRANTELDRFRPLPPAQVTITHPSDHQLIAEVRAGQRRGVYGEDSGVHRTPKGLYAVKVVQLKAPAPRWRKPVIIATVALAAFAALGALIWTAVAALASAIPASVVGGAILVGILLAAGTVGGGRVVDVLVRVRVK